jgi:hypothetical protein
MAVSRPRAPAVLAGAWAIAVGLALVVTLESLAENDFDGLNNVWQIPFALPWFLLPIGTADHVQDAWMVAGLGWLNAVIVYIWMVRRRRANALLR